MDEPAANLLAEPAAESRQSREPAAVLLWNVAYSGVVVVLMAVLRLWLLPDEVTPIGYGVPLIAFAWLRDRRLLWVTALAFAVISWVELFVTLPTNQLAEKFALTYRVVIFTLVLLDLLVIAGGIHLLIGSRHVLEGQNAELEEKNRQVVAREEEISRQNEELQSQAEELQSQAEELERQGEELRAANEELTHRGRMLESLLALSRSLTADLPRDETLRRICGSLGELVDGEEISAAIKERRGDELVIVCHEGFAGGPVKPSIPYSRSFASLVLDRGQTGYVEDIELRPDLEIPQPREGPRLRSVLASPLKISGHSVGTLEVFSPQKRTWSRQQIAVLESLAAQASVSLEAAELFEQVDRERRRFQAVFDTLLVGVAVVNADYTDLRMNPAGAAIAGVNPNVNLAPAAGQRWTLFKDGRPLAPEEFPLARTLRSGQPLTNEEIEVLRTDGRRVTVLTSVAPVRDKAGKLTGAVLSFVDVTQMKAMVRELEVRRAEAEEASVRKTRFLAAVSHDIRTPANAINLLAELLRRASADPRMSGEIPEMAGELQQCSVNLVNLVSDVLDVARYDFGKVELQVSEFPLAGILADQYRQMLPLAEEKNVRLEVETPGGTAGGDLWLRTDRVKLARVINNLVGNAIKFTPEGSVRVSAERRPDGGVAITVADTGVGIDAEHLDRIFDEFFQLRNPERDRNKGTGLGLAICKRLVDAMGGTIEVRSTPGEGSRFTVALPPEVAARRDKDGGGDAAGESAAGDAARKRLSGARILLVEDHPTTMKAAAQILEREGAEVVTAADGATALRMLKEASEPGSSNGPQILLLDMMLPDVDGREVLRQLQQARPAGLRCVLVLTGDITTDRVEEVKRLGADALLAKPIDLQALLDAMENSASGRGCG